MQDLDSRYKRLIVFLYLKYMPFLLLDKIK